MNIRMRYFTMEDAQALLPKISDIFSAGRETKGLIEKKVEEWRLVHKTIGPAEEAVLRGQLDFLANRLENQMSEITQLGCLPKDLDLGLVDFPARIAEKEGYLCWKMGEDTVSFWHGLTEGYTGRKRLSKEDVAS